MTEFIGRGEQRVVEILKNILPNYAIVQQMPIVDLIKEKYFKQLAPEYNKHKHDIVLLNYPHQTIVIEVNYKHGKKADAKWKVYKSLLEQAGHKCVTIEENECISLFELKNGIHTDSWSDYMDVIRVLERVGISPN